MLTRKQADKKKGKKRDPSGDGGDDDGDGGGDARNGDRCVLTVEGRDLGAVLAAPGVDGTRTTTNHVMEVERVLGIEAARASLAAEVASTMVRREETFSKTFSFFLLSGFFRASMNFFPTKKKTFFLKKNVHNNRAPTA